MTIVVTGCSPSLQLEDGRWNPVCHRVLFDSVFHSIRHQPPPAALFAQAPAGEVTFDDRVHLQPLRMIFAVAVGFAREQGDEIDEDGPGRVNSTKDGAKGLAAVPDLLHRH